MAVEDVTCVGLDASEVQEGSRVVLNTQGPAVRMGSIRPAGSCSEKQQAASSELLTVCCVGTSETMPGLMPGPRTQLVKWTSLSNGSHLPTGRRCSPR